MASVSAVGSESDNNTDLEVGHKVGLQLGAKPVTGSESLAPFNAARSNWSQKKPL